MVRYDTFLFDLDGTLIDAFTTIHRSYVHTLPQFGRPPPTMEEVHRAVGGGLEAAMRHFLPDELIPQVIPVFNAYTQKILLEDVKLMPGARELLETLHARGAKLAVFTNKLNVSSRRICDHLGVTPLLNGIFAVGDTPWLKPQPEFARHVLQQLGSLPEATLLIGDSSFDVQAAHNGGFACWCVTTGTHRADELHAAGADRVLPDLIAVRAALEDQGASSIPGK